ncbi:FAD-dependent monooxygenase [Actinoplanes sp. NPDC051475]|uniref:FAD-dependent oxidoreductase n=1 Tax=Actinoplanes sp. NPDC051475 TaxID=3157225 RepID=UPI00344DA52D
MPRLTHAVVLGAGMAGVLAASALVHVADAITIVEQDRLPERPTHRTGLPQARHAHVLWSGGARAIDQLLPGAIAGLLDAGAHRLGLPADIVFLSAHGWFPRTHEAQYAITCTRDLMDWRLREQLRQHQQVTIRDHTKVVGLRGDAKRITGIRVHDQASDTTEDLDADIVIDATGRGSRSRNWLTELSLPGIDTVREDVIDSGLAYSTRLFRAPAGATTNFPLVTVQPDVPTRGPARAALLVPVEHGRWLVTLAGTRGAQPPTDETGFAQYARHGVAHPIVADLIATARPITPIHSSHSTANRRLYVERLPQWPDGLVMIGDALASYNPIYGHGMAVAAYQCLALRKGLQSRGADQGSGRRLQRLVGRALQHAWDLATSVDIFYPHAGNIVPGRGDRARLAYVNRVIRAAMEKEHIAAAFFDAITLSTPPTRLASPRVLLGAARAPRVVPRDASTQPPITAAELRCFQGNDYPSPEADRHEPRGQLPR